MASVEEPQTFRQHLWGILHFGKGKAGHRITALLIILIILSTAILPLEAVPAFEGSKGILFALEISLTGIFTLEYVLRLYAAPERLRYVFSFFGLIDLLSILPFYLGLLGTQYLRAFRLARLLRLLKLSRIEGAASVEKDTAREVELLPGESVEHVVTRHPIFLLLGLIPPLITTSVALSVLLFDHPPGPVAISVAVTLLLFSALFLWKALLDYNYDVIYVTTHRLIFQNWHLFGRDRNQVNYAAITNVKQRYMGIIGYFLGIGAIVIETPAVAAGKIEQTFVGDHEGAARRITGRCFTEQPQRSRA